MTRRNRCFVRWIAGAICALAMAWMAAPALAQTGYEYQDLVGYTDLANRLGLATPNGSGVDVTQTEAATNPPTNTAYLPNASGIGGTLIDVAGGGITSAHATGVADNFYRGAYATATGVSTIFAYESSNYILDGFLKAFSSTAPGTSHGTGTALGRIHNHSWTTSDTPTEFDPVLAVDVLRRMDWAIDQATVVDSVGTPLQSGFTAVVGVANNLVPIPKLLGNSYNAIAVGVSDGGSSNTGSTIDGLGRSKPDLVAPGRWQPFASAASTSRATARVSAAATLLMETAIDTDQPAAQRPETIKALLMAGATKTDLPSWSHSETQPLDLRYGAGVLNIDHSHRILEAGQQSASDLAAVSPTGWDLAEIEGGQSLRYFFEVTDERPADGFSAVLTWHRRINLIEGEDDDPALLEESLANLDLRLFSADGTLSLGGLLAQSISTIDNVEHIYLPELPSGWYALEVTALEDDVLPLGETWQYALAWDARAVPEPASIWLAAAALTAVVLYVVWYRARQMRSLRPVRQVSANQVSANQVSAHAGRRQL